MDEHVGAAAWAGMAAPQTAGTEAPCHRSAVPGVTPSLSWPKRAERAPLPFKDAWEALRSRPSRSLAKAQALTAHWPGRGLACRPSWGAGSCQPQGSWTEEGGW